MAIDNRGPQVEAVAILFLTLSWIAVGLRCYVKLYMTKLFRTDDWLAVISLVSFTFFCAVVIAGAKIGTGRHIKDISKDDFSTAMMWWYCGEISYVTTTAFIKASIALFLLQICVYTYQKFTIWSVAIISTVFSIAYVMVMTFQCHPISYFWTRFLGEPGTCIPATVIANMTYAHGAITTFSDWTLGILPIFLVWNLNMNPRTKVSVALILGLGALGSTASIVRFPYIYQLTETDDFLWSNTDVSIWSTIEPGIGITASSMATMRPLFVAFLSRSRLFGSSTHQTTFPTNTSRLGCFRKNMDVQELELRSNPSKTIRVTTTIVNTQSARTRRNDEVSKSASDSDTALNGDSSWGRHLETDSLEDVGHHTTIEGGASV